MIFYRLTVFDRVIALAITAAAPVLKLISWKELEHKIDWGILLLFGGGLCLSMLLKETGTSIWMAKNLLSGLEAAPSWLLILSCIAFMIFFNRAGVKYRFGGHFNPHHDGACRSI